MGMGCMPIKLLKAVSNTGPSTKKPFGLGRSSISKGLLFSKAASMKDCKEEINV